LGQALDTKFIHDNFLRENYFLLTKVGRIGGSEFDYSPEWIRYSIQRSLERLKTTYLDVVYCHDVEFVSAKEVLTAVRELRRIREEIGTIKYIGISGYPVPALCELAELVLKETGEPLDAVMSYANFTLQNTTLSSHGVPRLRLACVDVVLNASPLGMGLLRRNGVPVGGQGDFHPAERDLRQACLTASNFCDERGEKLEVIAIRYALEQWARAGAILGSCGDPASGVSWKHDCTGETGGSKLGVSVLGVSFVEELDEIMKVWRSILDGMENTATAVGAGTRECDREWSIKRQKEIEKYAECIHGLLGKWRDHTWASPSKDFFETQVTRKPLHTADIGTTQVTPPSRDGECNMKDGSSSLI
jgi:hypothetical protein